MSLFVFVFGGRAVLALASSGERLATFGNRMREYICYTREACRHPALFCRLIARRECRSDVCSIGQASCQARRR
jgi:hypothetical protein